MILTPTNRPTDPPSIHNHLIFFFLSWFSFHFQQTALQNNPIKLFSLKPLTIHFPCQKLLKIEINLLKPKLLILLLILLHPKRTTFVSFSFVFETFGPNSPSENSKPQVSLFYLYTFYTLYIISEEEKNFVNG